MKIDNKLLEQLEKLSSLEISSEKRDEILKQLSDVVSFVEILDDLDLKSQKATFTTATGETPTRADVAYNDPQVIVDIMKNAPAKNGNFFSVPKIIE